MMRPSILASGFSMLMAVLMLSVSIADAQEQQVSAARPEPPEGMVYLPGGPLPELRDSESGKQPFTNGFFIDEHEVTNRAFARFLSAADSHAVHLDERMAIHPDGEGGYRADEGHASHPVVYVDWYGAFAYAAWLGRSLPTEEEWIYACTGGVGQDRLAESYPWGDSDEGAALVNSLATRAIPSVEAVGSYPNSATPTGLQDMAGNAAEWTLTAMTVISDDSTEVFVVKGGGCTDPVENMRLLRRSTRFPTERSLALGFRCIQRLESP